jgi:hypothetical protein
MTRTDTRPPAPPPPPSDPFGGNLKGVRMECRKCGAILPGPVEICPICYADQTPRREHRERRQGNLNVIVFGAFVVVILCAALYLLLEM